MRRWGPLVGVLVGSLALVAAAAPASAAAVSRTGNVLVLLQRHGARAATAVQSALARAGAIPAGRSVPQIGLITVRPPAGADAAALARRLARVPGVGDAQLERRYVPRLVPNDPALVAIDPATQLPFEWELAREGFYNAWKISQGTGALVGVIDTGIDATHPDLESKIAAAIDQESNGDPDSDADTDQVGHGTHVASIACAATDNGIGIAGAGYNCGLVIEKTDFSDSSIAASIVDATDRHVGAINMSFGPQLPTGSPAPVAEVRALQYAVDHQVVLVAAAADTPTNEQGDPGNVLQPAGTGPHLGAGIGLDVTAAGIDDDRAEFAGYGSEISLAAFGSIDPTLTWPIGPDFGTGIFGAFPANATTLEGPPALCACRVSFDDDDRYAYLEGTSMAAPQVAAVAAMMRALNPYAPLSDLLRILKQTATRPAGVGFTTGLGWGILNAGGALEAARRLDRLAPTARLSSLRVSRRRVIVLRWSGEDQQAPGLIASGLAYYDVYVAVDGAKRARLLARTARTALHFRASPGHRYSFSVVAVDRAGNRQRSPTRASLRVS